MILLVFRIFIQALACFSSIGQGALRARHCMIPAINNRAPEMPKVHSLYFDNATSHGTALTILASAAPAPSVTNNAGRAQHINVPSEVNRLTLGHKVSLFMATFARNIGDIITGIGNEVLQFLVRDIHAIF